MYFMHNLNSKYRNPKNWKNETQQIIKNPYRN